MERIVSLKSEKGIALVAVVAFTFILTVLGFSVLIVASSEVVLVQNGINRSKAFYLAEAGVEVFNAQLSSGTGTSISETSLGEGSYKVDYYPAASPPYAIATGAVNGQEKRIKVRVGFLAPPFECGIYAGGLSGDSWTLLLRGAGNPTSKWPYSGEKGGKDIINGNIFVDGDVAMYEESSVNPPLAPNPYGLAGDVDATGDIDLYDSASIAGDVNNGAPVIDPPDLIGMNYAINNTHNVSQIFASEGVTQGYLPNGHELRDVFEINPANMTSECASTTGDDFFLTTSSGFVEGNWKTAQSPLDAGSNRVYYIDGDLWVHSKSTFGFNITGRVTIVATGDIHLCDNLAYADANSILGLVALGKYDEYDELESGGNVYFGDPTTGTLYTCSAMMFAANNFLYNSTALDTYEAEPESGFILNGSIAALNTVSIERDWYTKEINYYTSEPRPARYDIDTGQWIDSVTGEVLDTDEISSLRHYQMELNYDDRVRSQITQPPGLPRGVGLIFEGLFDWEELP